MKDKKAITLKTLNKSNIWDLQENDVFRLLESAEKDADAKENIRHYTDIIKTAFETEEVKVDKPEVIKKYEARGFKVAAIGKAEDSKKLAIKKRPIMRVTDLTYENIRHISATKLVEVLDRNFGGGWESLPQSIQDIIESGFDISTTTLPKDRLHKPGGLYEKKTSDGYEVLEIPKGSWTEAIFAKEKPEPATTHSMIVDEEEEDLDKEDKEAEEDKEEEVQDKEYKEDDDDDSFDDEKLTEESYRTTYETSPEELNLEAEDISDDEEY